MRIISDAKMSGWNLEEEWDIDKVSEYLSPKYLLITKDKRETFLLSSLKHLEKSVLPFLPSFLNNWKIPLKSH